MINYELVCYVVCQILKTNLSSSNPSFPYIVLQTSIGCPAHALLLFPNFSDSSTILEIHRLAVLVPYITSVL